MKVLQFFSVAGMKLVKAMTALLVLASAWNTPSAALHASNEPVYAKVHIGQYMEVDVTCSFTDHTGTSYAGYSGREDIIVDAYTGQRMFCVEPGPLMDEGIHYPVGTMQSHFGKEKGDQIQLIAHYGTVSGNDIDYLAAQCLIWEIGCGASVRQIGANAAAVNAAKAVILSRVREYLASGKQVMGTSMIYRSTGQDIMSVGSVFMDRQIDLFLQKKSAQLSITSSDPSYSLKGAVYHVYQGSDTSGRMICELVTDENGSASASGAAIREDVTAVTVVEVQAPEGYVKDDTPYICHISDDGTVRLNIDEQPVTQKVKVSIHKSSSNPSITEQNGNYDLCGAVFEAFYETADGKVISAGQLVTDHNGFAEAVYENIPLGVNQMQLKELTSPKGYYRDDTIWKQTIQQGKTDFFIQDTPALAQVSLQIEKQAQDPVDHPLSLAGAQFTIRYYAVQPGTSIRDKQPERSWAVETKEENGVYHARLEPSFLVSGDSFYQDEQGKIGLPVGIVTIQETKAPEGYRLSHTVTDGTHQILWETEDILELAVTMDSDHSACLSTDETFIYHEEREEGGLSIRKNDADIGSQVQGDAKNLSAVYQIVNLNPYDVAMKVNGNIVSVASFNQAFDWKIVTDGDGCWQSQKNQQGREDFLQTGRYRIEEVQAPEGYLLSCLSEAVEFEIQQDQQTVILTDCLKDQIIRGGFTVQKQDEETVRPQGEAQLQTVFTLYNRSMHPVMVNGRTYDVDQAVDVDGDGDAYFTTDENGMYITGDHLLPYGSYELVEVQAPVGYQIGNHASVSFSITSDGQMADLTGKILDQVVTGKVILYKHLNARPSSEWDNQPEEGAVFLVLEQKKLKELFQDDMKRAYEILSSSTMADISPKEYSIITTDAYGLGTSCDLAYGTYVIAQIAGNPDTELIEDQTLFTVTGSKHTIVDVNGMEVTMYGDQLPQIISATNDELTYQIVIVKKDAETGKTVTYNGASFMIGYDCDGDGQWTEIDRNHTSPMDHGNRIVHGFVTQKIGTHSYDVFRTYSDQSEVVEKGTFVVDEGNSDADDPGRAVTPLHVSAGSYFIFEMDHDETGVNETPAGYVSAGRDQLEVNGVKFTQLEVSGNAKYEILYDETAGISQIEKTYRVSQEVYNRRALGSLRGNKSILHTVHDTSVVDLSDPTVFSFELIAKEDIRDPADGSIITSSGMQAKILKDGQYVSSGILHPDHDGVLQLDHIPLGTYILREINVPEGFADTGWWREISFLQPEDDRTTEVFTANVNIINHPTRTAVSKIDITDGKQLPGAFMKVTDMEGNVVDEWISDEGPHIILGLHAQKTYVLHEDLAPVGYVRASSIPFTLQNTVITQKITMVDEIVSIYKQDASFTGIQGARLCVEDLDGNRMDEWISDGKGHKVNGLQEGNTYVLKELQAPSGYVKAKDLTFTVSPQGKIQEEIMVDSQVFLNKVDQDGNGIAGVSMQVLNLNGQIMDAWVTDGTPHAMENLMETETYRIRETEALDGYVKAEDQLFTVNSDGENQIITVVNYRIGIHKTDEKGNPLSNASVVIKDENGNPVDAWISDGTVHHPKGLQEGHVYTLHEEQSEQLQGYYLSHDVTIDLSDLRQDMDVTMVDDMITVQIEKVDEQGNPVTDIRLQLIDQTGNKVIPLPQDGFTGKEPIVLEGILEAGHTYILEEIQWKEGYHPSTSIRFELPLYGTATPLVIRMMDLSTDISVWKQDDQGKPVAGAGLQIIEAKIDEDGNYVPAYDEDGNLLTVTAWKTGLDPVDVSGVLKGGNAYIVQEVETPDGYETAQQIGFTATGTTEKKQGIIMTDHRKTYYVTVQKQDSADYSLISGAEIGLYHPDGTIMHDIHGNLCLNETDENGQVLFEVLYDPKGCDIKEVTAPQGYVKTEQIIHLSFVQESDENGVIRVSLTNDRIPDTSDPFSLQTMLMVFAGACMLMGVILFLNSDRFRR